eukprot:767974-Hanusia_phi.AAC.2
MSECGTSTQIILGHDSRKFQHSPPDIHDLLPVHGLRAVGNQLPVRLGANVRLLGAVLFLKDFFGIIHQGFNVFGPPPQLHPVPGWPNAQG